MDVIVGGFLIRLGPNAANASKDNALCVSNYLYAEPVNHHHLCPYPHHYPHRHPVYNNVFDSFTNKFFCLHLLVMVKYSFFFKFMCICA